MSLIRVDRRDGVAVVTLDRPRANALSPELVDELRAALSENRDARGVVLASSQKIFSGGWDLPTIVSFDRSRMTDFVDRYTSLIRDVFAFPAPVVAALPGHAIAGGLILAAAADERIAGEGASSFGLSEVALGVPLPRALFEIFRYLLGERDAERLAATAENLPLDRALSVRLLDRAVPPEELGEQAFQRARTLAGPSASATAEVKRRARADALARFDCARENDPFLDFWFSDDAQRRIRALVERLKNKN